VIVPGVGADGPDGDTLLDAAMLAAHFSSGRGELVVDVAATRRKHVQKGKGQAAGAVRYSQERNVAVRADDARLTRLLASEIGR
jgi:predicted ribosome quality control (RQC) complex YloA/Tae2 family protein